MQSAIVILIGLGFGLIAGYFILLVVSTLLTKRDEGKRRLESERDYVHQLTSIRGIVDKSPTPISDFRVAMEHKPEHLEMVTQGEFELLLGLLRKSEKTLNTMAQEVTVLKDVVRELNNEVAELREELDHAE